MHWSALLLAALGAPAQMEVTTSAPASAIYSSYTQAWHAAREANRPLVVILNPGIEEDGQKITEADLRADEKIQSLLNNYVVAVIDTSTSHGQQVKELFGSPALPRLVVIDKTQKKQIFHSSTGLNHNKIARVLEEHKDGVIRHSVSRPIQKIQTYGTPVGSSCPNCQKGFKFTY